MAILIGSCAVASPADDMTHLAAQVKGLRGRKWLSSAEYKVLKSEYLSWIDARVKAGDSTESINRTLDLAGLLPRWADTVDEMFKSHAGYLEVSTISVRGADDILVIAAGTYVGVGCSLDVTAVLYDRRSRTRLADINAESGESQYAFYLSGLDVAAKDASGRRVVASGWTISNCTSTWNGKRIRIDRVGEPSIEGILARDLDAQDRDGENVDAWVQGDVVTFWYQGAIGDPDLLSVPAIARYRVLGNRAIREAPLALTRAGFIREWLTVSDAEAVRWGDTRALEARNSIAAQIEKHGFQLGRIARCGGTPPVWEIGVSLSDVDRVYVFRISGARATELRMIGVPDEETSGCTRDDIRNNLANVATELPW